MSKNKNNNNFNNFNNSNFNENLNSNKISTFKAVNLFKDRFKSMSSDLFKKFNIFKIFTPLQLIVIAGIIIVLLIYFFFKFIHKLLYDKTLTANLLILKLNNNIPYIGAYYNYSENSCFYDNYIYQFYSQLINENNYVKYIDNSIKEVSISTSNYHTINFWIIVTNRNSPIVKYFEYKLKDNLKIGLLNDIFESRSNLNKTIFNFKNYKFLFSNNYYLQYENIDVDSKKKTRTNVSPKFNKWENITIVIKDKIVSIYLNTQLLYTGKIELKGKSDNIDLLGIDKNIEDMVGNHGFPGFLNYFSYFSRALEPDEIENLYEKNKNKINSLIEKVNKYNIKNVNSVIYKDIKQN